MKTKNAPQQDGQKKPKIQAKELMVVAETAIDGKGRNHKLRVVKWEVDGVQHTPKLEKRGFYAGRKGERLTSKEVEPLTLEDLKILAPQLPRVIETMQNGVFAS